MLACKEIVRILSSEESLPFTKKAELKMHLLMCKHCSNYSKQLSMLKSGIAKVFSEITKTEPSEVEELEEQVIKKACGSKSK